MGLLRRWDERNQRVIERQNATLAGDDWVERANARLDGPAGRSLERYWKVRTYTFVAVVFVLVLVGVVKFIASGF